MIQRSIAIESSTEPTRDFHAGFARHSARHRGRAGELIGRRYELDRIAGHIDAVRSGRGGVLIVVGEPGIGKTALLGAATRLASDNGVGVVWGEAKELEQRVPFAAIGALLSGEDTAAMSPGEHPDPTADAETVADTMAIGREMANVEALLANIEARCAAGPLVLVVDDAHWADPSSLLTLRRLCDLVPEIALLVILAVRPMPQAIGLGGPRCSAEQLHLGPMADSEVGALVEASLGSPAGPRLSVVVSGAGGNPLYVIELVTGLMHAGLIEAGEISSLGAAFEADGKTTNMRLPESLTDVIVRRLDYLPSRSRQILPMAASLGPCVEAIELSEVLGAPLIDVWNAISVAVETGILVRSGADLIFRHDLIRQVLADQLPLSTQTTLQLRAARVLMSMQAPVERVATYLLAGDGLLDQEAVEWLVEVAERLTVRTPELATGLLGRAVATPRLDPGQYDSLRFWQVRALLWGGDAAAAEAIARGVLSDDAGGPPSTARDQLHWLLAHAYFAQGKLSDAVAVAESVLAQPGSTSQQQGQYHGFRALSYLLLERFDIAEEAAALAISAGDAGADPVASGLGSLALGSLRFYQGFLGEAQEHGDRLVREYEDGVRRLSHVDPYSLSGRCLTELDRHAAAEKTLRLAIRHSEDTSGVYLGSNRLELARLHFLEGRWDETISDLPAGGDGSGMFGCAAAAECFIALVSVHRNTYAGSPESLPTPDDGPRNREHRHLRPWVQALAYEAQGQPDRGLEMFADVCGEFTDGWASATVYHMYPDLVRLALATGRDDMAIKIAAAADALDGRYSTHSRRATAALCRGLAEGCPELIDSAAESFRQAGRPWYEAQAYENLAALLAGRGLREARAALEKAIELYTGLEAEWDIARAEARLREFGIRRGRRGPRNRPKEGWEALTPTERKVAALVAQGKSNADIAQRMFLSPRTIQSHVSSILAKLSLQSRVQIAVGLARRNS